MLIYTNVRLRDQKPRPPIGLMYLAAALRPKYEPIILDMRVETDCSQILKRHLSECIFVGISAIIGQQLNFSLEAAKMIKEINQDMPIVFGGTFPSMAPQVVLREKAIDIVSIGDGEDTILNLADTISEKGDLLNVDNIAYKMNGEIVLQQGVQLRSLNTPLMPAWDLIDVKQYREINVLTSKGCSAGCNFCYNCVFNHQKFRARDLKNVLYEIEWLHKERNAQHIAFVDDNFFEDMIHAREIMTALRDSGWNMTWETTCRADDLAAFDDKTLQLLVDAGCKELFVGFESTSDEVLKNVNKNIVANQMDKCMQNAQKFGFQVRALFVIGLIGETRKELLQTLKTVDVLKKEFNNCVKIPVFGIYTPYPQMAPDNKIIGEKYKEPETMGEWSMYHHDRANHQWLKKGERAYLENIVWVYRYYSKRSRFLYSKGWWNKLLYFDALIRWKWRFFSVAPEWAFVRNKENKKYFDIITEVQKEYEEIVFKYVNY